MLLGELWSADFLDVSLQTYVFKGNTHEPVGGFLSNAGYIHDQAIVYQPT